MSLFRRDKDQQEQKHADAPTEKLDTIKVEYKGRSAVYHITDANGRDFSFTPGVNDVAESDWQFMLTNPHFKRDVDHGLFEISKGETEQ